MSYSDRHLFAALFVATLAAYANSFGVPFIFDDLHTIINNPGLRDLSDPWTAVTSDYPGRPALFFTFALNFAIGKTNTLGYHIVNFAIHITTVWLVFLIVADIFRREGIVEKAYPAGVALIFALHPLNTEAVTYISSRSTSMATMLYLLAFRLTVGSGLRIGWRFAGGLCAFAAALFTKEIAVTFPVLLTIFLFQFEGLDGIRRGKGVLAMVWGVLPFFFLYRAAMTGHPIEGHDPNFPFHWTDYFRTQLAIITFEYLPRMLVPVRQILDADIRLNHSFLEPKTAAGLALLGVAIWFSLKHFFTKRIPSFAIIWFVVGLSVTSSVFPIYDTYVERRLYVALPSFCMLIAYLVWLFVQKRPDSVRTLAVGTVVVAMVFGTLTYHRNKLYASPLLLWEDTMEKTMLKSRIYAGVAREYILIGRYDKAEDALRFGRTAFPDETSLKLAYCWLMGVQGRFDEMETALNEIKPVKRKHRAEHLNYRAVLEGQKKNFEKSEALFKQSLELVPEYDEARANLAVLYARFGKNDQAIALMRNAIRQYPGTPDFHYQLGNALLESDRKEAYREYRRALEIDPKHPGAKEVLKQYFNETP